MSGDPIRLLDDPATSGLLRGDLATAGAARVQGLDHAAGLGALKAALGAETGAIPAVAAGGAGGSLAAKLLLGAALVGGVAWWATSRDDGSAIDPLPPVGAPAATPTPTPEPAPAAEPPKSIAPVAEPTAPEAEVDPPVPVGPEEAPSEPELVPEAQPKSTRPAAQGEARGAMPTRDTAGLDDAVVREAKQIQAARRALGTDAARALSLTQSIAVEFPRGQLVEERLAIAIRALAKLGRIDEARTKAEAFLESYGRGAHAAAVRRAVGLSD